MINVGLNKEIGNGKGKAFWLDIDGAEMCFVDSLPSFIFYTIVVDMMISVAQAFSSSKLYLKFRRQLTGIYLQKWNHITHQLEDRWL